MAPRPVYLHIGLQKTGTSYLQSLYWASQEALRREGLDLVPETKLDTFHLMLCVRDRYERDLDPPRVADAVRVLPDRLAAAPGSRALVTEESLAAAATDQAARLVEACAGREVHLVLTVRDLARQLPSAWQQELQAGATFGYGEFLDRVTSPTGTAGFFWDDQDVLGVLDRWEKLVPAERIHLVTVPPRGAGPEVLLGRFCAVLDVDPAMLTTDAVRNNPSLGHAQAELLRRVNAALPPAHRRRQVYGDVGKRYFSVQVLGRQPGRPAAAPARLRDWTGEYAEAVTRRLVDGGYRVVGDLADLRPAESAFLPDEEQITDTEVAEVASAALAAMLDERMTEVRRRKLRRVAAVRRRERQGRPGGGTQPLAAGEAEGRPSWLTRRLAGRLPGRR